MKYARDVEGLTRLVVSSPATSSIFNNSIQKTPGHKDRALNHTELGSTYDFWREELKIPGSQTSLQAVFTIVKSKAADQGIRGLRITA
jgi:hydroxyacyl-ACP dehydratase HTD2-like protein with hotdog domain